MPSPEQPTLRAQARFAQVEKYLNSGLTQKKFCKQEALAYSTLQLWLKKYRRRQNHCPAPTDGHVENNFVPLAVQPPREPAAAQSLNCVIEYPNGTIVRLSGTVPSQLIPHLLEAAGG